MISNKILLFVALSISLQAANAVQSFNVQEVAKGPIPKAVRKLLKADPSGSCGYEGKRLASLAPHRELWMVTTTCGGSGGSETELALTSSSGAVKVLNEELVMNLEVTDSLEHGLPSIVLTSGGTCCGTQRRTYSFDGVRYYQTGERSQDYLLGSRSPVPDELLAFFRTYTKSNACVQKALGAKGQVGDIGGFFIGKTDGKDWAFLVTSNCGIDDNFPVWVIKAGPSPHIILTTSVPDSDIVTGPQLVGLPDICFIDNDPQVDPRTVVPLSCWRYDGTDYKAGPKPRGVMTSK